LPSPRPGEGYWPRERVLHPQNRAGDRAWVAARPTLGLDLVEEIGERAVEEIRLLDIEGMPRIRKNDERRGCDRALHQDAGFEAGIVLVAGRDQCRHLDPRHLIRQLPERRTTPPHTPHGVRSALRRMLGKLL